MCSVAGPADAYGSFPARYDGGAEGRGYGSAGVYNSRAQPGRGAYTATGGGVYTRAGGGAYPAAAGATSAAYNPYDQYAVSSGQAAYYGSKGASADYYGNGGAYGDPRKSTWMY